MTTTLFRLASGESYATEPPVSVRYVVPASVMLLLERMVMPVGSTESRKIGSFAVSDNVLLPKSKANPAS